MRCTHVRRLLGAIAALALGAASAAHAEAADPLAAARQRFLLDCATCHGVDATGNGPVASVLKIAPPDLTRIASRHGGVFSYADVYATIDGRMPLAHGTREMPIWGNRYKQMLPAYGEKRAHERIDGLVRWLESIQVP
ncbi:MAG TPA: cytochrome C [Gammaproteobacteria bacterium]|nr:cytochrome C [Gammaproteobacteria bacterium]